MMKSFVRIFIFSVLLFFLYLYQTACLETASELEDNTTFMVQLLDSLAANVNPNLNIYANNARIEFLKQLPAFNDPHQRWEFEVALVREKIKAGKTQEALEILYLLSEQSDLHSHQTDYDYTETILDLLALAWLRLGEQQNCIINHSAESCLFPIQEKGIHTITEGSEKAIYYYERILQEYRPNDLEVRWLLNIAYMTLGIYPESVPEQWLIPYVHFDSSYPFKRFQDIASSTGLADIMALSGGSITEDFNNNGFIDIMASSWGLNDQLHLYMNNGNGTFTRKTEDAKITGIVGGLNIIQGDFNNNGFVDVFVLRGAWLEEAGKLPNSLLRNNGDGTFSDVTKSAGLLSFHPTQTAVWADLNNNGWLDLFIGNETTSSSYHPTELYLSNKDGTFTNVSEESGAAFALVKGVTAGDYNNNGFQDLYLSILDGPNILLQNNGPDANGIPQFNNVSEQAGVQMPETSFPTWFWDFNNNGWLDLFAAGYKASGEDIAKEYLGISHQAELSKLYHNNGDGTFQDITSKVGLDKIMYAMGSNFGDLDNNGYLDFYVGTGDPDLRSLMPNRMFKNENGEFFHEVTTPGGFGHLQKGHGVSFADLNNNGQQDIFTVIGGAMEGDVYMNALFKNPGHDNRWITLMFHGEISNRFGVGNRVKVQLDTENGSRTIHRTVTTGGSFGSSSLQLEIGLGGATRITQVDVEWPASGIIQVFKNVSMDRFYLIIETSDQLTEVERKSFDF